MARSGLVLWFFGSWVLCPALWAQDIVIVSSATNPAVRIKREGLILDFRGPELKLRSRLGAEERIPASRIVEIQTTWTPPHVAGRTARSEGRFDDALAALRQAQGAETRPWAQRQIAADLSGCCLDAGRIEQAVNEFLAIVAIDPDTRHFDVIPIGWRAASDDPALEARAMAWLALRRVSVASLLGASWLLSTSHRGEAIAILQELQGSSDPRIAGLAAIQVWRTKIVSTPLDEARRWQAQLEKMPHEIQATGWYVLGEIYARHDQPQLAALAWLKIPLLYRQQRALAADALLAAGGQLEKMSQPNEAAGLYRELTRDFPQFPASVEAGKRLAKLPGAG